MKFDLDKSLKHTVILVHGESTLRREAVQQILKAASDGDDFDVEQFIADSSKPMDWLASASTAPFLSPRRVAVIRQVLRSDAWDDFKGDLPESGLVLLVADEENTDDAQRSSKFDTALRNWTKTVNARKGIVVNLTIDAKDIVARLRESARASGKDLSLQGATLLKDMCGDSYSRAMDELEKLMLYVGDKERILENDIKELVVPSREWNVFKLIDAIIRGDASNAMKQLRVLVGGSQKAESAAFSSLLPLLSRNLRLVFQARVLRDHKATPANVGPEVKALLPEKANILGEKEFPQSKAIQQAQHLNLTQIGKCLSIVADTDARLKGQLTGFSTIDSLERMVLEMVDAVKPQMATFR